MNDKPSKQVTADAILKRFRQLQEIGGNPGNKNKTKKPGSSLERKITLQIPTKDKKQITEEQLQDSRRTGTSSLTNPSPSPIPRNLPLKKEEPVLTKNEIIKEVAKVKPLLQDIEQKMGVEHEDFTPEESDLLSEMLTRQNNRLCDRFNEKDTTTTTSSYGEDPNRTMGKRKPGCVFQVVFNQQEIREKTPNQPDLIVDPKKLRNGYACVTEVLEIYMALADPVATVTIQMKNMEQVSYHSDLEFEYFRIRHTNQRTDKKCWVNIGFIFKKQFNLFDRMMFLARQVSRTSPGRLFENKLLYQLLQKY